MKANPLTANTFKRSLFIEFPLLFVSVLFVVLPGKTARLPLSRNSDEIGFAAPWKDQNGDGFLMGLDDQSVLKTVSTVATALWVVCLVWEGVSKWTGHRPVATAFMNPL